MFGGKAKKNIRVDTLIGQGCEINGDVLFSGGLHVDGTIRGNVIAEGGDSAVLIVTEKGQIEGEVRAPNIVLNGVAIGDVWASTCVELAPKARVNGNIYYERIEMALGAEVNGQLVRAEDQLKKNQFSSLGQEGEAAVAKVDEKSQKNKDAASETKVLGGKSPG